MAGHPQDEWQWETVTAPTEHPCGVCQQPTHLIDIDFEAPCCSRECVQVMWDDYCRAVFTEVFRDEDVF